MGTVTYKQQKLQPKGKIASQGKNRSVVNCVITVFKSLIDLSVKGQIVKILDFAVDMVSP